MNDIPPSSMTETASPIVPVESAAAGASDGAAGVTMQFSSEPLGRRAMRGGVWTISGYGASQVLRLASNLILTRLLAPELFGIMALVSTFIQGLHMFSDVGIGLAIVQNKRGDERRFLDTAWTIQAMRGTALWLAACLIAWPAAHFWGNTPELKSELMLLIPICGLSALISGFNSTAIFQLDRHLQLGKLTLLRFSSQVISVTVILVWALFYRNIWALVGGGLVGALYMLYASHHLIPGQRNRFSWDAESRKALFHFGRWIFFSTLLTFFAAQSDRLIFGKMIPMTLLGVYSIAAMLATMPTMAVVSIGASVAMAAYSRVQDDLPRFRRVFGRLRLPLTIGGGLIVTGLIGCGPSLIRVLYDSRYSDAGWILQLLAIGGWFQILETTCGSAILAMGEAKWIAAGNAGKLVGMLVFMPAGYYFGHKLYGPAYAFPGAIVGLVSAELVKYMVIGIVIKSHKLPIFSRDLGLTALTALFAAASIGVDRWVMDQTNRSFWALLASGITACILWTPFLWVAWRCVRGAKEEPSPPVPAGT